MTDKNKPTDAELNRKAAEVAGWPLAEPFHLTRIPNYCGDRNALEELWCVLEKIPAGMGNYGRALINMLPSGAEVFGLGIATIVSAPCRLHVIAFLKAMDAWPSDWEGVR